MSNGCEVVISEELYKVRKYCFVGILYGVPDNNMNMDVVYYFKVYVKLLYTISRYRT